ncbi:phenylalanine--tRNA ligase subunit beta [Desulfurivibrio alkaliphilus]|uniref:Phenylalanine--tRNA ligase beta subunit n=1 Tax=Desulfurivibrio alkaliphilus (strain DSM 19089 / UNIQEM U267 / AHT2) TaxID=589865 RepID=D6Z311_DESAT|nr:phenylalanine--tRNA ligase subunit beta [Desulfurivibrio alkaliphilus]ADH85936.1 phenylalanyl-tRNA synthetase, beta subunit [Desulfurivibrio alkaliphilus AHT 2]
MKFTYNWLREYVAVDLGPEEIAARLTLLGLEVDAVEPLHAELAPVKVARVAAVHPHPNADRLTLCDVEEGETELRRVVCGAPNVRAGMFSALVTPGMVLPGGLKIKASKIRGERSEGMLCSEEELGLAAEGDGSRGIMDLDPELFPGLKPGIPFREALGLADTLIEVDLTPNRPDCTGVIGIAREVAGFTGLPLKRPVDQAPGLPTPEQAGDDVPFTVSVEAADCHRYAARLLRNVRIAPSPPWMRQRLQAVGLRPINNVVDVTNLVMLEYGQPMHAFDFDRLSGGQIRVRRAAEQEKITTLDGVERELTPAMLVIADADRAVAVAGVMGGASSEVGPESVNILLESACFEAKSVRATAAALKLNTDSSYRFERGVDPQLAPLAMERAVRLIQELAGAQVMPGGIDYRAGVQPPPELTLRLPRVNDLLGTTLDLDSVEKVLAGIEIRGERVDASTLRIIPPSFRVDLEREVDLIEEVARLIGYDQIPAAMPKVAMELPPADPAAERRRRLRALMLAAGCCEAINYSFVNPAHADTLRLDPEDQRRRALPLLNPLSEELGVMRTSLLPGLLENARHNINHQSPDLRLFELGKVFYVDAGQELPREEEQLAAVFSGRRYPQAPLLWNGEEPVDIHDVKGVLEELLAGLSLSGLQLVPAAAVPPYAVAGFQLSLNREATGEPLGEAGKIQPAVLKAFGIKQEVFYLDLNLTGLSHCRPAAVGFKPLPRFPAVKWDLALLVPEEVEAGEMLAAIRQTGGKLLEQVEIFDVYRGKHIEPGRKSVAFAIQYRDAEQTLNDKKVGVVHGKIIKMLEQRFHGQLREA